MISFQEFMKYGALGLLFGPRSAVANRNVRGFYDYSLGDWLKIYLTIMALAVAPIASALTAGGIASLLGCSLNEGSTDCPMGGILYVMFVSGWFAMGTLPIGALLFCLFAIINCYCYFTRPKL